ncbi:hypothetical protein [Filobacillus milosensis]|uniref:hypothetical protein n=1 Tax=Filobacillus milosensis TaxID=94137 RepID=UPI00129A9C48|nr:hypothetical protein [Filobacillus milosensis]
MSLGYSGTIYQLFSGASSDDFNVTINIVNADTGEVFDTVNYSEDRESFGQ